MSSDSNYSPTLRCPRCGTLLRQWKCSACPFKLNPQGKNTYGDYLKAKYFWDKVQEEKKARPPIS